MILLLDIFIVLVTLGVYFAFGWLFFSIRLFKDYEVQGKIPVTLFSITFSLSCLMFQLVIFEILHVLNEKCVLHSYLLVLTSRTRYWTWSIALCFMLILLTIVFPFVLSYLFLRNWSQRFAWLSPTRLLLACILFSSVFLFVLWKVGDPFPILKQSTSWIRYAES